MSALTGIRSWGRLFRLPLAPTAIWDALACLALALAAGGRPLSDASLSEGLLLGATSLLLYTFGMALNDLADLTRDRVIAPDRPLPSGEIRRGSATLSIALLGGAAVVFGGGPAGSRIAVGAAVLLAIAYNVGAKRWLAPGALTMGGVRFANASIGVWPLVCSGTAPWTALLGPLAIGLYSAGITIYSTTEEAPSTSRRIVARALSALAFLLAGLLPWIVVGKPTLGLFLGALVAGGAFTSIVFARRPKAGPVKRQVLEMLLGLYWLAAVLATATNGGDPAAGLGALVVAWALIVASQLGIRALR